MRISSLTLGLVAALALSAGAAVTSAKAAVDCTRPFEPLPAECAYDPNLNRTDWTEDYTDSHANDVDSDAPSEAAPSESEPEGDSEPTAE